MIQQVSRLDLLARIEHAFSINRIVYLTGPRQYGKTPLARLIWENQGKSCKDHGYFDLENPADLSALQNPDLILPNIKGLIIIDEVQRKPADENSCYFRASHNKAELDLLIIQDGKRKGFEFKLADASKLTPSMEIALTDLKLDSLQVIYPGSRRYFLRENIEVCPSF